MSFSSTGSRSGLLALPLLLSAAWMLGEGVAGETTTEPVAAAADSVAMAADSVAAAPGEAYWVLGDTLRVPTSLKGRRLRQFIADSLTVNSRALLALHAEPYGTRSTPEEIAGRFARCDSVRTAIPPGEWEVYVAVIDFDQIAGVMFAFDFPEGWVVHGFQANPRLKNVLAIGGLKSSDDRPRLIVFDCVAHPDHINLILPGTNHQTADVVVIGSLEITATSPGTIRLVDHPDENYGPPEIATCLSTSDDISDGRRGRIDVGRGPGKRLCAGEEVVGASRE